jgi:hypothetical protein
MLPFFQRGAPPVTGGEGFFNAVWLRILRFINSIFFMSLAEILIGPACPVGKLKPYILG